LPFFFLFCLLLFSFSFLSFLFFHFLGLRSYVNVVNKNVQCLASSCLPAVCCLMAIIC
jgi:hypothetical protein